MQFLIKLRVAVIAWLATALLLASLGVRLVADVPDFTILQATDIHTPMSQSQKILSEAKNLGEIDLTAYGIKAPAPSLALVTGDMTEFGGGNGWWNEYLSYFTGWKIPVYHSLGNHDNTWHAEIRDLRKVGLGPYYSFDSQGCHFICLMSPTPQDPRPSLGEEQIVWLRKDLKTVSKQTPIFFFVHHPLGGTEFASPYDWYRLLDVLRPYNIALFITGHYHTSRSIPLAGIDQVVGGTTFGPNAGLTFISIKDNTLRVAYQRDGKPTPDEKVFEKSIAPKPAYPKIRFSISRVKSNQSAAASLSIRASISGVKVIDGASCTIDDEVTFDLKPEKDGKTYSASQPTDTLLNGQHYLRVTFKSGHDEYSISQPFEATDYNGISSLATWRAYLAAASKTTPTVSDDTVFVGDNSGNISAYDAKTGKKQWSVNTGAEILTQPLVEANTVYVGNGNGLVLAYSLKGKKIWQFEADDSVYSSPVYCNGNIVFGANSGKLYGVNARSGKQAWVSLDATYAIESKPWVSNGRIYYGAWDQYVHCVDGKDGSLVWKTICEGSNVAPGAKRYYSAADAMPVVAGGKVYIADRNYWMTVLDADTGARVGATKGISATGISEDGKSVYLRMLDGHLNKIDTAGNTLWSTDCDLGAIPAAPAEKDGIVYVSSAKGKVSAVSADSGKILWQYQASPQLFVMAGVASDGKNAYVPSFDGYLTAIKNH